jgi:hypothetical protein
MTHHPPLITILAPTGTHHTPSVANRPLLKTQKRLHEPNFYVRKTRKNYEPSTAFAAVFSKNLCEHSGQTPWVK